jgi:hypothetical protein
VTEVKAVTDGHFEIMTAPGPDPRPLIASKVVTGGWKLLELRRERLSLEEIFIKLTRETADSDTDAESEADTEPEEQAA